MTESVRLTLKDVKKPVSNVPLRVFVNKPDANAKTPTTDPHYLGAVSFYGAEPTGSFQLDAGDCFRRLGLSRADPIEVTLVPLGSGKPFPAASVVMSR